MKCCICSVERVAVHFAQDRNGMAYCRSVYECSDRRRAQRIEEERRTPGTWFDLATHTKGPVRHVGRAP